MKHIKIKGEYKKDGSVSVTILEQTHCGDDFGLLYKESRDKNWGSRMFRSGRYGLYSPGGWNPQVYNNDHYFFDGTLFLLGDSEVKDSGKYPPFICTLEEYKQLKRLVEMYNLWGSKQ